MEKYLIRGGNPLFGEVEISGAKNAVVAILSATLLANGVCRIENIPNIADVTTSLDILENLGAVVKRVNKNTVEVDSRPVFSHTVPHDLARKMRASYYFMGALLSRFGAAKVAMPGGCNFGVRPIDKHLKGFIALGADVAPMENGMIELKAERLVGSSVYLEASVGATVNVMLAAVKARGVTVIENAAKEPHVVDLANFLNSMGADIRGAGTDVIKIRGVDRLYGTTYSVIPDQIEAGTFMAAAVATGGDVLVRNVIPKHLESITAKLLEMGAEVEEYDDYVRVCRRGPILHCNVKTMPHPGFPTDMQPQLTALMTVASGESQIREGVYDKRFGYVSELAYMGAKINVDDDLCVVKGVEKLNGAKVRSLDLRAGAAMIIAGLMADGVTEVEDKGFIERGYEDLINKFRSIGADITREEV